MSKIVDQLLYAKEKLEKASDKPMTYINTYQALDDIVIDYFKDRNIVVITSNNDKYYRGAKIGKVSIDAIN